MGALVSVKEPGKICFASEYKDDIWVRVDYNEFHPTHTGSGLNALVKAGAEGVTGEVSFGMHDKQTGEWRLTVPGFSRLKPRSILSIPVPADKQIVFVTMVAVDGKILCQNMQKEHISACIVWEDGTILDEDTYRPHLKARGVDVDKLEEEVKALM